MNLRKLPIFHLESVRASFSIQKNPPMQNTDSVGALLRDKASVLHSIPATAIVLDAIKMMAEKNIGAVPVLQQGKLVGMFSERDYTRKVVLMGRTSKDTFVGEIMTRNPETVTLASTVNDCMEIMTEQRTRHLPVIENGEIVGILSIGDLVKWIISAQSATIEHLTRYVFGEPVV
jgi:CBS domain-containing protein